MIDYRRLRTDLLALGLLAAIVFVGLSLWSYDPADPPSHLVHPANAEVLNVCGPVGARLAYGLRTVFGWGAFGLLAAMFVFDMRLFSRTTMRDPFIRCFGWGLLIVAFSMGMQLLRPDLSGGHVIGSGGYVGAFGATIMKDHFSTIGSLIIISTLAITGLLLASETALLSLLLSIPLRPIRGLTRLLFGRWLATEECEESEAVTPRPVTTAVIPPPKKSLLARLAGEAAKPKVQPGGTFKVNPPTGLSVAAGLDDLDADDDEPTFIHFELPDLDLLEEAEEFPFEKLAERAQAAAVTLEKTFDEFGLNVKVAEIDTGPVVTQFELELDAGLRVSKVVNLQDDLAIALRVPAVRVVSPIPGKNTVGVEVPNDRRVMVRMKELIQACQEQTERMKLPLFLGKDVCGHPLAVDLAKMPHLLIAGRTGTGKSVCLNTLILSLLMSRSPNDVKMLMIDPKMVELSPYMRIPHLMHPVITDMKKAEAVLSWAVDKMEERYDLLARCGVRHLDSFNKLGRDRVLDRLGIDPDSSEADDVPEHMPYIVIFADEMADMIMTSGKDVEGHIIRLAQKSRAVGIHLVLATQKPTVDVITGLIKSNLPARIAFQVASKSDSRVVLDESGAERLLGNGDMLYLAPGTSNVSRAQGTFVSDDEMNAIIDFFSDIEPQYSTEIAQATSETSSGGGGLDAIRDRDDLYAQACEVVIREGRGSCSLLQRALGIGYGRAARMIDYMAEDGIVGAYNGSKHREVMYTMAQWEEMQESDDLQAIGA
ncbi:MAG: DNA translocase FtsK 4TM domain-containing protein [Planctomycetaceae bacterium]|nr:DNA translocase FtsK 4TM domain-containing protein [Planctomycetaceae bacterium]